MNEVNSQIVEILRNSGSKERFIGVVDHYEGSTLFIRGDDQKLYLAFTSEALGLQPGQLVSYRKDQSRAKEIKIEPEDHGKAQDVTTKS
jgi:hypothetical protein